MKNILVVDDSPSIRQMLSFTLVRSGYSVDEAVNGDDGLSKVGRKQYDLVMSDVNMPGMNGYEFVKQLRGKSSYKFTPILMLTTESSADKKELGKQAGATGWLVKPFNPDSLLKTIQKVLG